MWLAVTAVTASAAAAPFLLPDAAIARIAPRCESMRLYGRPCFLCGSTTGFLAIGRGDFASARSANRLAIPLFAAFSGNAVAALAYLSGKARRRSAKQPL
ncbi:MAG: DUF2752 domain-containing protein [Acidobacteria bacterium]|nr:DUF2752 domain-containing protein [Acidobacteriota bacterium]